ncbi:uncharacterized protein LOC118765918 [Octopus sinensis]|uniref:Uncharacterized protein LOC118765918 n=1 Tax=Octopus sinensis TaxID=2607531 RepID=A0A7E6FA59_9MOLL|nr:uncharacterized protein LOC118765918 [Octopus sinensis]
MAAVQTTTTATSSLILSIILIITLTSLNIDAKELGNDCEVKIPPNISEILSRLVKLEKEVFNFEVHLSNKTLDELLNPVPLDYFANARSFTWIPDKSGALTLYRTFSYDFSMHTFNMLDVYVAKQRIDINITCGKQNIQRHDLIYLIFKELKRILFIDKLQMGKSGYMCFFINLSQDMKKNSPHSFETYRRIGINREIIKNYCCKLYKNESNLYRPKSVCSGKIIQNANFFNYLDIFGGVLWLFFPLIISFVSKAKLPSHSRQLNLPLFAHDEFLFTIKNTLPHESEWINGKHNIYTFSHFLSWLFCFHHSTLLASRLRRFLCILFSLSVIFLDLLMHYFFLYETIAILFQDGIPLGHRALILGIPESYENTDGFFGGPFVWLICYVSFNFILFVLPSRLSETIAYNTLHQRSNFTFLIQNITLLEKYGNLDVSTLQDYDLLYAVMEANVSTALNPNFWYLIIYTWSNRIKKIWLYYYRRNIFWQFFTLWLFVSITILFAVFSVCELFLCLVYYGIPIVYLILTLPLSYFRVYIYPLYLNPNYIFKLIAFILTFISFLYFLVWAIYSIYISLTSFQVVFGYIFSIAVALLAKPGTVGDIWFVSMFLLYGIAIIKSIQKRYNFILLESIKLTKILRPNLVQSKYGEEFINTTLFKRIVNQRFPLRNEIGKSIVKLFLIVSFFFACNNIISLEELHLSASTKITLILMTSMIPKLLSMINADRRLTITILDKMIQTINLFEE